MYRSRQSSRLSPRLFYPWTISKLVHNIILLLIVVSLIEYVLSGFTKVFGLHICFVASLSVLGPILGYRSSSRGRVVAVSRGRSTFRGISSVSLPVINVWKIITLVTILFPVLVLLFVSADDIFEPVLVSLVGAWVVFRLFYQRRPIMSSSLTRVVVDQLSTSDAVSLRVEKRRRCEMSICIDYPHVATKRPRKVATPTSSAISSVTPENDAPVPLLYHAPLHHYHHYQNYYPPAPPSPFPPAPLPQQSLSLPLPPPPPPPPQVIYSPSLPPQYPQAPPIAPSPPPQPVPVAYPMFHYPMDYAGMGYHEATTSAVASAQASAAAAAAAAVAAVSVAPLPAYYDEQASVPFHSELDYGRSPGASYGVVNECGHERGSSSYNDEEIVERRLRLDVENSFLCGGTSNDWDRESLVKALTKELEDICVTNTRHCGGLTKCDRYEAFFSRDRQNFNLEFYVNRLVEYSNCSAAAAIVMLVYIDRVQEKCKSFMLNEINCHRMILTGLVLGIKYMDDEVFSNAHYASVGGIGVEEMNGLEAEMLEMLSWELFVTPESFKLFENGLLQWTSDLFSICPPSPDSVPSPY